MSTSYADHVLIVLIRLARFGTENHDTLMPLGFSEMRNAD